MTYSQKYTIVHLLEPMDEGIQFHMSAWPLHVTLADVFAVDITQQFVEELTALLHSIKSCQSIAGEDTKLGTTKVILVNNSIQLQSIHEAVIHFLESKETIFNMPQYNYDGFLPHSTISQTTRLLRNDIVSIDNLSIIDMFPSGEWKQRKVLFTIQLA
jgi:hypothetical protein